MLRESWLDQRDRGVLVLVWQMRNIKANTKVFSHSAGGLGERLGPHLVTALAIGMGKIGWVTLAFIFLVTGLLMRRLVTGTFFAKH